MGGGQVFAMEEMATEESSGLGLGVCALFGASTVAVLWRARALR